MGDDYLCGLLRATSRTRNDDYPTPSLRDLTKSRRGNPKILSLRENLCGKIFVAIHFNFVDCFGYKLPRKDERRRGIASGKALAMTS